jgi:serine/threonine protein kinase
MLMKLLDHPNIIKLYDLRETSDRWFLIMEYASGGEVFQPHIVGLSTKCTGHGLSHRARKISGENSSSIIPSVGISSGVMKHSSSEKLTN